MTIPRRHNFKWSVNEINSLHREYELLKLDPQEIADKHNRSVLAILFKLKEENIIENSARNGWRFEKGATGATWVQNLLANQDEDEDEDEYSSEYEDEEQCLSDSSSECSYEEDEEDELSFRNHIYDSFNSTNSRVAKLEESLDDIKNMISHMFSKLKKNKVLRSYEL